MCCMVKPRTQRQTLDGLGRDKRLRRSLRCKEFSVRVAKSWKQDMRMWLSW